MVTFVSSSTVSDAAGSYPFDLTTVPIGTGTNRKAIAVVFHKQSSDPGAPSFITATRDPGGADEAMTFISGASANEVNSGDAYYSLHTWYLDLSDGLSGDQTFRFSSAESPVVATGWVIVYEDAAAGAPEADEFASVLTAGGANETTISDSITTVTDGAKIVSFVHYSERGAGNFVDDASFLTPDNGQTERYESVETAYLAGGWGDLDKATAGAQTIGWTSDEAADVIQQVLLSVAPSGGGSSPTISGVTDPVKPGDTLTISGSNLDTVTSVTFAGVSVTLDSQTASAIDITVPSAYTNGLAFQSQTVQVTDGSTPDSTTTTFNPPTNIDYNGAVSGYDALPMGQYSIFDDVTLSVVDGDDYVVRDPNTIVNSLDASGAGDFTTTGDIFVRVLDVSDTTDGPDGTWTVERTVSITASQVSSIVRRRLGRNSSGLFGWF